MTPIVRRTCAIALTCLLAAACKSAPRERPIPMGPVDTGAGSVVLTDRVHATWILQQGSVLRERLGRKRRQVARFCPALQRVLEVEQGIGAD